MLMTLRLHTPLLRFIRRAAITSDGYAIIDTYYVITILRRYYAVIATPQRYVALRIIER